MEAQKKARQRPLDEHSELERDQTGYTEFDLAEAKRRLAVYERHIIKQKNNNSLPVSPQREQLVDTANQALGLITDALSNSASEDTTILFDKQKLEREINEQAAKFELIIETLNNLLEMEKEEKQLLVIRLEEMHKNTIEREESLLSNAIVTQQTQIQAVSNELEQKFNSEITQIKQDNYQNLQQYENILNEKAYQLDQLQQNIDDLNNQLKRNEEETFQMQKSNHDEIETLKLRLFDTEGNDNDKLSLIESPDYKRS